jgi:hypothetical protein
VGVRRRAEGDPDHLAVLRVLGYSRLLWARFVLAPGPAQRAALPPRRVRRA